MPFISTGAKAQAYVSVYISVWVSSLYLDLTFKKFYYFLKNGLLGLLDFI